MKISKKVMVCVATVLAVVTFFQTPAKTLADSQPLYVSDIKMSWVDDEDDADEAKKKLEDAGYTVVNQDLNAGTNYWAVSDAASSFIGYKTTTNPDEAITDISMMNMKGGYVSSNLQVSSQQSAYEISRLAGQMKLMCKEMKENIALGSPVAKSALYVLNTYIEDVDTGLALGDYLLSEKRSISDYYKIITVTNSVVLAMIYAQLTYGVAEYNTKTNWMQRMKMNENDVYSDKLYYDSAEEIRQSIITFAEKYEVAAKYKKENGKIEANNVDTQEQYNEDLENAIAKEDVIEDESDAALYLGVYAILEKYPYGDSNLAKLFTNTKITVKELYPLVESMTPGQLSSLRVTGLTGLVLGCENTTATYKDVEKKVDEAQTEVTKDTDNADVISNDKVSVWVGSGTLNKGNDTVGITSEAYRTMSKKGDYSALMDDSMKLTDKMKTHIYATGAVIAAAAAYTCIFVGIPGAITGVGTFAMLKAFWTGIALTIKGLLGAVASLGAAVAVVAACLLVIMAIVWIGAKIYSAYSYLHPKYTVIPEKMVDLSGAFSLNYDVVTDMNGEPGDLNGWDGQEWLAMYTSKDARAGSPILANFMTSAFKTVVGNGITPDDCTCAHLFGEIVACNTNLKAYEDRKGGIYLFYVTEESQGKKASDVPVSTDKDGKPIYLKDVILITEKTEEAAKFSIERKKEKYQVVPFNLTRKLGYATYIGYTTTTDPDDALTDLRVAYQFNEKRYTFGDAIYGNCGTAKNLSEDGTDTYTLYETKYPSAGDPIYANIITTDKLSDAPTGYNPVTLFSAGQAFDFNIHEYETSGTWGVNSYIYFSSARRYIKTVDLAVGTTIDSAKSVYDSLYQKDNMWRMYSKNLTPGTDKVTYLVYQTTIDENKAIRDIRVGTYSSLKKVDTVTIGEIEYEKRTTKLSGEDPDFVLLTSSDYRAGEALWDEFLAVSDGKYAPKGYNIVEQYNKKQPTVTGIAYQMADSSSPMYLYTYHGGASMLSGITFAGGNEFKDLTPHDMLKQLGCIDSNINVGYCPPDDYKDFSTYLGYALTDEPKRALHDIQVRKGDENEAYEQDNFTIDGVGYAACETYIQANGQYFGQTKYFGYGGWFSSGIGIQNIRTSNTYFSAIDNEGGSCTDSDGEDGHCRAMYVTAGTSVGEPLTIDKLCFRSNDLKGSYKDNVFKVISESEQPAQGYLPVKDIGDTWNDEAGPVTLTPGTDFKNSVIKKLGYNYYFNHPIYLYVLKETKQKLPYIASVGTAETSGNEAYDKVGAYLQFLAAGATDVCDNTYYTRTDDYDNALKDIINVVVPENKKDSPPGSYSYHGVKYYLSNKIPFIQVETTGFELTTYLYKTSNNGAGEPIINVENKFYTETLDDMKETESLLDTQIYAGDNVKASKALLDKTKFIMYILKYVVTKEAADPYITGDSLLSVINKQIFFDDSTGQTATHRVNFDFNYNGGEKPLYLLYNRTMETSEALTGLTVYVGENAPKTLTKDGIEYTKAAGSEFNSTVGGEFLTLYYTLDPEAGAPITSIKGSTNRSEEGYTVVKDTDGNVCDMNKGVTNCDKDDLVCYMHYQREEAAVDESEDSMASVFTEYQGAVTIFAFSMILVVSVCVWILRRRQNEKNS